jgi:predicted transcriptional regulator
MWRALAQLFGRKLPEGLDQELGPLEQQVLGALWARKAEGTVRELRESFPNIAYTTLMTTLDRLFRKGLLDRRRVGRAFAYRPRCTREELTVTRTAAVLRLVLDADPGAARPLVSCFVEAVGDRDGALLDELERLVQEKRRQMKEN